MDQEGDRGQLDKPVSETPDDTARIREQIEHTRANLSGTIEELQDRLRPENLVSQAGDAVRETAKQKVRTMVNTASDTASRVADQARTSASTVSQQLQSHPVPTAIALGGLAWWLMRSGRRQYSGYEDGRAMAGVMPAMAVGALGYYLMSQRQMGQGASGYYSDDYPAGPGGLGTGEYGEYELGDSPSSGAATGAVRERVRDLSGAAGERLRDLGEATGERARALGQTASEYRQRAQAAVGTYAEQAAEQARYYGDVARVRVEETTTMLLERSEEFGENLDRWMQENPLTVGIAAFALGAIAGLSLPVTEAEHRTLGAARERLMQQAGRAVEGALAK